VHPQLDHALPNLFAIAKIAGLYAPQSKANAGRGGLVSQGAKPFRKRFDAIFALIPKQLRSFHCDLKATDGQANLDARSRSIGCQASRLT
jgi:hypothetical protein